MFLKTPFRIRAFTFTFAFTLACAFGATTAAAQIAPGPGSPAVTNAAWCGGALPPNPALWDGEIRAWTGGPDRPFLRIDLGANGAVCNDGSPAAIFVRPAVATLPNGQPNPLRKSYLIHFKGGGSCRSFDECQARFCRSGPAPGQTDKPGLMSSRGWPTLMRGTGLMAEIPQNRFALMNQVLLGYCSSDTWIGSAPAGSTVSLDPGDDPADVANIAFMGEAIVSEALRLLDSGPTRPVPGGGGVYAMRPLVDAAQIVIAGDSGGANGARHHLDRIAARYGDAQVIGMIDAGGAVDMADSRIDFALMTPPTDYKTFMHDRLAQARSFWSVNDSALDDSCIAAHPATSGDDYLCLDGYALQRDQIETDLLQRNSLGDVTTLRSVGPLVAAPAAQSVRELSRDGLLAQSAASANVSVLGANCSQHVTFRSNAQVAGMRTLAAGPVLYQELWSWVRACFASGTCPKLSVIAPVSNPSVSTCP